MEVIKLGICPKCKGLKTIRTVGYMHSKCSECGGVGYVSYQKEELNAQTTHFNADENIINEPPKDKEKKVTVIKKPKRKKVKK